LVFGGSVSCFVVRIEVGLLDGILRGFSHIPMGFGRRKDCRNRH